MSLDKFFESLTGKSTGTDEDQDLFKQFWSLDYNYGGLRPTNQPPSLIALPEQVPWVDQSILPSSEDQSAPGYPSTSTPWRPIASSTAFTTPATDTHSMSHHTPVGNSTLNLRASYPAWSFGQDPAPVSACASTTAYPAGRLSCVPRPTGLGTTSTYWNTRTATQAADYGTFTGIVPCASGCASTATHPLMPLVSAMPANAHLVKKLERTVNTTAISPDGHNPSQLMDQLKREAEDVLAHFGSLLKDSSSCPSPTVTDLLQPRNESNPTPPHSSLVQRTTKSGGHKIASIPYPTTHAQAKKTRVPGRYVCSWQGCNESFARKDRLDRHVSCKHMGRKDHRCKWCEYMCSRKDNLRAHMRNCKFRPAEL